MPSHYELLDVSPSANTDELRAAYRRQAFRHYLDHAVASDDATLSGEAALDALHTAYEVLSCPEKRRAYDEDLSARGYETDLIELAMDNFHKAIESLELDHNDMRSWRDLAPALLHPRLPHPLRQTIKRFATYWGFRYTGPGRRTVQDVTRQVVRQYETYYRETLWPE